MLNKSRLQGATTDSGRRRPITHTYPTAIPGASLRGPYKLWIPNTDNPQSESETEGPRLASSRHHGSTLHVAASNAAPAPPAPSLRHTSVAHPQHAMPPPQKQRTQRAPSGYSSEVSTHGPQNHSKSSSSFNLFRPHVKGSRGHLESTTRREELPRPVAASAAVPSGHTSSQPINVPQKSASRNAPMSGSLSTPSSTDPSPRSSTDSSLHNGHTSATAAAYSDLRKETNPTWNAYADSRSDRASTSRKFESPSTLPRREERRYKDKEDMVARVTEALGGGSTGKAKAVENVLLQSQVQTTRRDDPATTRRATSSTGSRVVEPFSQPQAPHPRRQKQTPQATPLPPETRLPDTTSKSTRHPSISSRSHAPPEPPPKFSAAQSKISASSSSNLPYPRTTSSPWPFNQALPPEHVVPSTKLSAQNPALWNHPLAKVPGSSIQQGPELRPSPKEATSLSSSRGAAYDLARKPQQNRTSHPVPHQQPSKSSLSRSTLPLSQTGPVTIPVVQTRTNPSASAELQRWSPNTPSTSKLATSQSGGAQQQPHSTPQTPLPTTSRFPGTGHASHPTSEPAPAPVFVPDKRYPVDTQSNPTISKHVETASVKAHLGPESTPVLTSTNSKRHQIDDTRPYPGSATSKHLEMSSVLPSTPEQMPTMTPTIKKRESVDATQPIVANTWSNPSAPQKPSVSSNVGIPSPNESRTSSLMTPRPSEQQIDTSKSPDPDAVTSGRYPTAGTSASNVPFQATEGSGAASTTHMLWTTTPRYPGTASSTLITPEPALSSGRSLAHDTQVARVPVAGTWTSKYTEDNYLTSDYESDDVSKETTPVSVHQSTHAEMTGHSPKSSQHSSGASSPDKLAPGSWVLKSHNIANTSTPTSEISPTSKQLSRVSNGDAPSSMAFKYASMATTPSEPTASRGPRSSIPNTVPTNQQTSSPPGAWTTSNRFTSNVSGTVFDPTSTPKVTNTASRETSARQATLGTTPVAGAWTTKRTSGTTTPSSEATLKQTSINPTPSPSSLLKTPASGSNTGTSTPSSTQISDLINHLPPVTSHSIATRVPISGHPSTPAPVRPMLRATPPPLSISSTSPDTDSLLTPSSLNSPRSTIALPQPQPVSTITAVDVQQPPEKESAPRKNAFLDFFRAKPSAKSYEVWTPPKPKDKVYTREEQPSTSVTRPKQSGPIPIPPRPKSPKFFSPFKLFSKRHRTVSSASLDVLDGTAPNTVMNSPASSMRADTPGAPPSPPLRDAFLATQEWRNKEATELMSSGRKRRHRPGVTFDCPEDGAPVDIIPSRLRIGRIQPDDDDY